jgi:hypothetical protein
LPHIRTGHITICSPSSRTGQAVGAYTILSNRARGRGRRRVNDTSRGRNIVKLDLVVLARHCYVQVSADTRARDSERCHTLRRCPGRDAGAQTAFSIARRITKIYCQSIPCMRRCERNIHAGNSAGSNEVYSPHRVCRCRVSTITPPWTVPCRRTAANIRGKQVGSWA